MTEAAITDIASRFQTDIGKPSKSHREGFYSFQDWDGNSGQYIDMAVLHLQSAWRVQMQSAEVFLPTVELWLLHIDGL